MTEDDRQLVAEQAADLLRDVIELLAGKRHAAGIMVVGTLQELLRATRPGPLSGFESLLQDGRQVGRELIEEGRNPLSNADPAN